MPAPLTLSAVAQFAIEKNTVVPAGSSRGSVLVALSATRPDGSPLTFLATSQVKVVPVTFTAAQPSLPVILVGQVTMSDPDGGFFLLNGIRTDTSGVWPNGVYVFGIRLNVTSGTQQYTGRVVARMTVP